MSSVLDTACAASTRMLEVTTAESDAVHATTARCSRNTARKVHGREFAGMGGVCDQDGKGGRHSFSEKQTQ